MENRGSADDVDDVAKDSSGAGGIQEHDIAEEFSSDLPSTAMPSSAPSGSSPYASLSSPSAAKVDDRDVAHGAGRVGDTKKLEHALPTDPRMQLPAAGFGMVDSIGRPPVVYASNDGVGPGAYPVRSSRDAVTSRTVRSPVGSYANAREFTNEESKQDDGVPNSAAAGIGVYAVEAQRVPDGNENGTVIVAEAQHLTPLKWYQRRWIFVVLALFACGLVVVLVVVLVVRAPSTPDAPTTLDSTTAPSQACMNQSVGLPPTGGVDSDELAKILNNQCSSDCTVDLSSWSTNGDSNFDSTCKSAGGEVYDIDAILTCPNSIDSDGVTKVTFNNMKVCLATVCTISDAKEISEAGLASGGCDVTGTVTPS